MGTPQGRAPITSTNTAIFSLVEVTSIQILDDPSVPPPPPPPADGSPAPPWHLDLNPGPCSGRSDPTCTTPGEGMRVFAEALEASGSPVFDHVMIVATVSPSVPLADRQKPLTVYLQSLDVDDPSSSTPPIDDDPKQTANGTTDNRGILDAAGNPLPQEGKLTAPGGTEVPGSAGVGIEAGVSTVGGCPAGDAIACTLFHVSTSQGDNYRVVASTSQAWLGTPGQKGGFSTPQGVLHGEVTHGSDTVLDPDLLQGPQVSQMLTVWRRLHLALKRMDPATTGDTQETLEHFRTWTKIDKHKLEDKTTNFMVDPQNGEIEHDWTGGYLWPVPPSLDATDPSFPDAQTVFLVKKSDKTSLTIDSGDMSNLKGSSNPTFYLRHDKLFTLTPPNHHLILTRTLLGQAYVAVVADAPNANTSVLFTRNSTLPTLQALSADTRSLPAYWGIPVVLGF